MLDSIASSNAAAVLREAASFAVSSGVRSAWLRGDSLKRSPRGKQNSAMATSIVFTICMRLIVPADGRQSVHGAHIANCKDNPGPVAHNMRVDYVVYATIEV
jgi:hypothetical protein